MAIDFLQAAYRHMRDAEYLEANQRVPNAAQLYGFAAECSLKATLLWKGYPRDPDGSPSENWRKQSQETFKLRQHIDKLSGAIMQIQLSASGRAAAKYLAMIPNISKFNNWSIDHRYYSDQDPIFNKQMADWKSAAKEMIRMLDQAKLDGMP